MSAEKESQQERRDSSLTAEDGGSVAMWPAANGDNDSTPRSEVPPPALRSRAPVRTDDGSTMTGAPMDYFAIPTAAELPVLMEALAPAAVSAASSTASASSVTATGHIAPHTDAASTTSDLRPPPPQTQASTLSVESADSAVTVLAPLARPRTQQPYPVFPNQSYAALHHQQYPQPYTPPLHRQRSAHLGNILTFTSALASTHQTGARTAGNSPAPISNTGLFDPHSVRDPGGFEPTGSHGTYPSPFLHFTHRQVPKETHVADVDVDTMSGRKVINHYEIVDELGRGTHGKVKLGRDLDTKDTFVAIKIVERYSKRRKLGKLGEPEDKVKKEVAILKKARHPNIVALLEVIDDPKRKKVYIVLELVQRGEILWRIKSPFKEVAILEARRYERERSGKNDPRADAEDEAIRTEATRRLAKKNRHAIRKFRQTRRNVPDDTTVFSHEMVGDQESGDDDDDRLSRISSTTADSLSKKPQLAESRLPSRPETPMMISLESGTPTPETPEFLSLTAEPEPILDRALRKKSSRFYTGLEGTMYGAYDASSTESSRPGSVNGSRKSTEDLVKLANEILDSELNPELEYVPVMTFQQARAAFRDTLLGLQYLHSQGIVHRDIKPPNLLSTYEHRVKISDFGVSYLGRPVSDGDVPEDVSEHEAQELNEARELAKTVGTPAFYAPELCITEGAEDPLPVTKAIDVWALGITLFCMIFARTPFVDQEFVVMRQIADEEIYIPRKRLVPAVIKPSSRPTSHRRGVYEHSHIGRRAHGEIVYEDIDDDLYDLLKQLLTKDPRKRMTLDEARRHPWVFADLTDKAQWLAENDPTQPSQIKKIEVSNEDVNTAVVPIQFMDRVRSGIKKVGERLGLSSGRVRGLSNASHGPGVSPSPSANSSSSNISQDARRHSLRGDESIFSALQKSRETEHPLAQSVAASPDSERRDRFFDGASTTSSGDRSRADDIQRVRSRPMPERSKTVMSATGSVRTLKASDYRASTKETPPPSPGLPGTPVALDTPGGSGLSAFFGSGPARRVLKTLRERKSTAGSGLRALSRDRRSTDSFDPHCEPSIAVSNTSASGHVNLPEALKDLCPTDSTPNSVQNSPGVSRPQSMTVAPHDLLLPSHTREDALSRQSSASSISTHSRRAAVPRLLDMSPSHLPGTARLAGESTDEEWQHGEVERVRKLILEGNATTDSNPAPSGSSDQACPPSPDDLPAVQLGQEPCPAQQESFGPRVVASSSSDFGSAISMSVSNPSMPSALSANSSLDPIDTLFEDGVPDKRNDSSDGTLQSPRGSYESPDEGYRPDMSSALNSDEDDDDDFDDSSDSDGGLVMTRRRSKQGQTSVPANGRSLFTTGGRRGTGASARSKKSSRSGSNNTMKKVRTRDSEDERYRGTHAHDIIED